MCYTKINFDRFSQWITVLYYNYLQFYNTENLNFSAKFLIRYIFFFYGNLCTVNVQCDTKLSEPKTIWVHLYKNLCIIVCTSEFPVAPHSHTSVKEEKKKLRCVFIGETPKEKKNDAFIAPVLPSLLRSSQCTLLHLGIKLKGSLIFIPFLD